MLYIHDFITLVWIVIIAIQIGFTLNIDPMKAREEYIFITCFWLLASILAFIAFQTMLIQAELTH